LINAIKGIHACLKIYSRESVHDRRMSGPPMIAARDRRP
jgi:hypothetical protein